MNRRPFWLYLLSLLLTAPAQAAQWSTANAQWLYGEDFELGAEERSILTLEYASGWEYGDHFFFFDVTEPAASGTSLYGEWHPRLSLGRVTGREPGKGLLKDVLLAAELNLGEGFRARLFGAGVDLNLPHFAFFSVNLYARDENLRAGSTWQLSPAWLLPFALGPTRWQFTGFADWAGAEGDGAVNLLAVPQLLLDLGHFAAKPDRVFAGIEYSYWHNKFGVRGVDERVAQAMLKWVF